MFSVNLNSYFYSTKKYYCFFDVLLKKEDGLKKDIMDDLHINYSTYRSNKRKDNSSKEYIEKLLNHFNYNDVSINNKEKYEILLSRIYYTFYYKQMNELPILLKELEKCILDNNYLKPLFIAFKLLCVINNDSCIDNIICNYSEEIKYLADFQNDYFIDELKLLRLLILFYLEYSVDKNEMENLTYEYPQFAWFYNHVMGSYYYKKGNDVKAYIYYNEALRYYDIDQNIIRKLQTINNIACTLNLEHMYVASLDKTQSVINYIYGQENNLWVGYITQHYLFSLFMLKRYEDIISFLDIKILDYDKLNYISTIICVAATVLLNKPSKATRLIKEKQTDSMFIKMYEYITRKVDKSNLTSINEIPYVLRIKEVLNQKLN